MALLRSRLLMLALTTILSSATSGVTAAIAFPGADPGVAQATRSGDFLALSNEVISASWAAGGDHLSPASVENKITGQRFDQSRRELFRLALEPPTPLPAGYAVMLKLDDRHVIASVSRDGSTWVQLASFPRSDFLGEPTLVRVGKMSRSASIEDYGGEAGSVGEGFISDIFLDTENLSNGFHFKTNANHAAATDFHFPPGTSLVRCRIDKGTDAGMTWGPALALVWADGKRFISVGVRDAAGIFNVTTSAGERIITAHPEAYPAFDEPASAFHFGPVKLLTLSPDTTSATVAEHSAGKAVEADATSDHGISVHWRAELRDGSNYIRQTLELSATAATVPLHAVELLDLSLPDAAVIGTVPGCPIAGNGLFAGVELPGGTSAIDFDGVRGGFRCTLDLSRERPYRFGQVTGVYPAEQLRRSFICYVERQRARPSRPFLHYNSWYDLGYDDLSQKNLLNAIESYDRELVQKRGVPIQSYLIDDGWDDPHVGLWKENVSRFPGGLPGASAAARQWGAHLGVWISPLGGYGGREERTDDARTMGLIPSGAVLDLSQPKYYAWFLDRCRSLMRDAGVNIFKWDKAGAGVSPHFMALLGIAQQLHGANPDLFINVTVGTWPSPFWLNFVDSTWRDGSADVGWEGKGADVHNPHDRERWLTFRDGYCYRMFVERSPLYPLNSVMHHGIVLGRYFQGADLASSGANLRHEARSYFANGASLQELYLSPSLMTPAAWDDVADAAKWAHANADVLVDSHWVGGDPIKLEPYGYAAWSPKKATLMLRNPNDAPATISIDAGKIFELPPGAATSFRVSSAYSDSPAPVRKLIAGQPQIITLHPFDVVVLEMTPLRS